MAAQCAHLTSWRRRSSRCRCWYRAGWGGGGASSRMVSLIAPHSPHKLDVPCCPPHTRDRVISPPRSPPLHVSPCERNSGSRRLPKLRATTPAAACAGGKANHMQWGPSAALAAQRPSRRQHEQRAGIRAGVSLLPMCRRCQSAAAAAAAIKLPQLPTPAAASGGGSPAPKESTALLSGGVTSHPLDESARSPLAFVAGWRRAGNRAAG